MKNPLAVLGIISSQDNAHISDIQSIDNLHFRVKLEGNKRNLIHSRIMYKSIR